MAEYLVILEPAEFNWSAYVPDLPGCIATGNTREETLSRMKEALAMHLEGLREDQLPIPPPVAAAEYISL